VLKKKSSEMADQFFYDVSVNNSQSENILDQQPATNIPELKTFSQFNHWTLIDGTEVDQFEENADAGIDEGHAVNDECVPIEMKAVHTQVETYLTKRHRIIPINHRPKTTNQKS